MPGQEGLDGGLFVLLLGQALSTGEDLFVDGLARRVFSRREERPRQEPMLAYAGRGAARLTSPHETAGTYSAGSASVRGVRRSVRRPSCASIRTPVRTSRRSRRHRAFTQRPRRLARPFGRHTVSSLLPSARQRRGSRLETARRDSRTGAFRQACLSSVRERSYRRRRGSASLSAIAPGNFKAG